MLWKIYFNTIKGFCFGSKLYCRWRIWIFITTIFIFIYLIYVVKSKDFTDDSNYHIKNSAFENEENNEHAVIIDAGSSGSRVYIYAWPPHSGDPQHLLNIHHLTDDLGRPLMMKITPGLSSFADEPFKASDYLNPLLQFAANHIPASKHMETPLFILATAGMRLLTESIQESILNDLRVDIPQNFSFYFPSSNVEVISGKQEGVYLWIAINYLLGRFDHSSSDHNEISKDMLTNSSIWKKNTVGILEMGGASLQIAYDVSDDDYINTVQEKIKTNLAEFNLGCMDHDTGHIYRVYISTHLGFSADRVRNLYSKNLIQMHFEKFLKRNKTAPITILDPCLSRETIEFIFNTEDIPIKNTTMVLKGTGNFDECYRNLIPYLDIICKGKSCADGIIHPKFNFSGREFYGFSEFWYTMEDVLRIGGEYQYEKFKKASRDYCSTRWSVLQDRFRRHIYPLADQMRLKYQCFKSVWMSIVLHEGLKIPVNFTGFKSATVINGQPVLWSLGAILYRTRYFPLRSLHRIVKQNGLFSIWKIEAFFQLLFYGCIGIVISAISIYLCRLRRIFRLSRYFSSSDIIFIESGFTSAQLRR